jgi:multisubunit Na+/H+ antiporter MnhF subunit
MSAWLLAGAGTLLAVGGCVWVAMRDSIMDRVLGVELGTSVIALTFLLLGEGFNRSIYFDLALVWAVLNVAGNLFLVRFLERWV